MLHFFNLNFHYSMNSFLDWIKSKGLTKRKLHPKTFQNCRGLMATKHIKKGECFLEIPKTLIVENTSPIKNDILGLVYFILSIDIDNEWYPYKESLPTSFNILDTSYFDCMEKYILKEININLNKVNHGYGIISQYLNVDFETFKWAWCCVNTRSVSVDGKICLIPFFDMLNHSYEVTVHIS